MFKILNKNKNQSRIRSRMRMRSRMSQIPSSQRKVWGVRARQLKKKKISLSLRLSQKVVKMIDDQNLQPVRVIINF